MKDIGAIIELVKAGDTTLAAAVPRMLAFIASVDDAATLAECKAKTAAISEYLARRKSSTDEECNAALKIKIRVEHRLGEVLAADGERRGGNSQGGSSAPLPKDISHNQSSRAQQLASLSWESIEAAIDASQGKASQASVLRLVGVVELKDTFEFCEEVIAIQKWLTARYQKWPTWAQPRFIDRLQFITELLQEDLNDGDGGRNRESQAEAGTDNAELGGAVGVDGISEAS